MKYREQWKYCIISMRYIGTFALGRPTTKQEVREFIAAQARVGTSNVEVWSPSSASPQVARDIRAYNRAELKERRVSEAAALRRSDLQ